MLYFIEFYFKLRKQLILLYILQMVVIQILLIGIFFSFYNLKNSIIFLFVRDDRALIRGKTFWER